MQIWCHFTDGETSAGHWVQTRGIFMLAEKDEKLHFYRRDGEAKSSIRTLLYTSYLHGFISRLARLPCRRVFCFRTTSSEMSKQDWHWPYESVLYRYDTNASCNTQKMHWKKPKHLAKGYVSAAQSWHIKNIDPEMAFIHLTSHVIYLSTFPL